MALLIMGAMGVVALLLRHSSFPLVQVVLSMVLDSILEQHWCAP